MPSKKGRRNIVGNFVNKEKWEIIRRCAGAEKLDETPVGLIVDSPWMPGYLGINTIDYLTMPQVWLESNLEVERRFPKAIFLPGFWVEMGMAAEPTGFGCKVSFHSDSPPSVHSVISSAEQIEGIEPPNPLSDGLMPVILNYYQRMESEVNDAGHVIKIVAARGPLTTASHVMGVSEFLLALKLNPMETHRLLKVTTTLVRNWLGAQANVLKDVEGILVLDDIAGFISEKDYLEFAHPYLKEIFDAFPGAVKMFHNDTNNTVAFNHLPDLGIDIFNFTHEQPIAKVRELVGPKTCLMGNVPPLEMLATCESKVVKEKTRECLETHGGQPGLILSVGGGVSPETSGENINALIETVEMFDRNTRN